MKLVEAGAFVPAVEITAMIREMTRGDIQKLPALHASATSSTTDQAHAERAFRQLFPRLYFDAPWASGDNGGLVSETADGALDGALGVATRQFLFDGKPVTAGVSSEFFVDPQSRAKMLGIQILKQFLEGPHDIAIADIARDNTRQIWLRLGGIVASLYSANWLRVIRPAGMVSWTLRQKPLLRLPAVVCSPASGPLDRLVTRMAAERLDIKPSGMTGEQLTPELFTEHFDGLTQDCQFRPCYDLKTVQWLWCRLEFLYRQAGPSRQVAVRDQRGNLAGWYIYQGKKGSVGRVAQIVASSSTREAVFRHLLADAHAQGLVAIQGRIQPQDFQTVLDNGSIVVPRRTHVLVHSRDEHLLDAFRTGRAFLSLLEGEAPLDIWYQTEAAVSALADATDPHAVYPEAGDPDTVASGHGGE